MGGWPTLSYFSIDESTLVDNATSLRQRRGTGFAFTDARLFAVIKELGSKGNPAHDQKFEVHLPKRQEQKIGWTS